MAFIKKSIIVGGRKVFYWEKNSEQKEVMILLHGFPGTHEGMIDMADNLGNFRFIIPDLPACGLSEPLKEKHNLENYSNWLYGFFEVIGIDRAIVVGHSFGSRLALFFGNSHPEKVERLVLITPVVKVDGMIDRILSIYYEFAERVPKYFQKMLLSNGFGKKMGDIVIFADADPKVHREIIKRDVKEIKKLSPQVNIEMFDEFYRFSLLPIGKKVKIKSLVIACDLDRIAPLSSVKDLAGQLSDTKLEVMKNCGHLVPLEKPKETAGIIREWLS